MLIRSVLALLLLGFTTLAARADITHIVLIWLPESAPQNTAQAIIDEATILSQIPGVSDLKVGPPQSSDRERVDDSFAVGISLTFSDPQALADYLVHPLHTSYVARHVKPYSSRLQIYDIAH